MELTMHAQKRLRQRGFPFDSPELILSFGRKERAKENAIKYFFGKKEYEKADQEIKNRRHSDKSRRLYTSWTNARTP